MKRINGLTNHIYMICLLGASVLVPLVLNASLELVPMARGYELVILSLFCVHGAWLIVVANEIGVFGSRRHYGLIGIAVASFAALCFFLLFPASPTIESSTRNEIARALTAVSLCITFSISALIADRVSHSRTSMLLNFWLIMNWPFFLFIVAHQIRKAAQ